MNTIEEREYERIDRYHNAHVLEWMFEGDFEDVERWTDHHFPLLDQEEGSR